MHVREKLDKAVVVTGYGMWQHPVAIRGAMCEDGVRRTIRLNQQADTFFTWSGRTTIKGKSTRGCVYSLADGDYQFIAYTEDHPA